MPVFLEVEFVETAPSIVEPIAERHGAKHIRTYVELGPGLPGQGVLFLYTLPSIQAAWVFCEDHYGTQDEGGGWEIRELAPGFFQHRFV